MKRLLLPLIILVAVSATAIGLSNAFFSDEETSVNNTFQAGAIDLKVDNTSYYNGELNQDTTFGPVDLNGETYRFFNFLDIKPGDWGEDTISLRVDTNDAWACYNVTLTSNDDKSCTEPENLDDPTCPTPSPEPDADFFDGELAQFVQMVIWKDDGDNVLESDEPPLANGPISEVAPLLEGALADAQGGILGLQNNPMLGEDVYYLGKAWCFGTLGLSPLTQDGFGDKINPSGPITNSGITCDGSGLNNATQTDVVTADITFSAIQSRNNPGYICPQECVTHWADGYTGNNQAKRKDGTNILADRTDPNTALVAQSAGTPYDDPVVAGSFFSLGFTNGNLTIIFNQPVTNNPGNDLKLWEVTGGTSYPDEIVQVEASQDNSSWTILTSGLSRDGEVDLGSLAWAKYFKITDVSNISLFESTADGYDLDGVQAICSE